MARADVFRHIVPACRMLIRQRAFHQSLNIQAYLDFITSATRRA